MPGLVHSFNLWTIAPVHEESGVALLGEAATKWVPVSAKRFSKLGGDSTSLTARLSGESGENSRGQQPNSATLSFYTVVARRSL